MVISRRTTLATWRAATGKVRTTMRMADEADDEPPPWVYMANDEKKSVPSPPPNSIPISASCPKDSCCSSNRSNSQNCCSRQGTPHCPCLFRRFSKRIAGTDPQGRTRPRVFDDARRGVDWWRPQFCVSRRGPSTSSGCARSEFPANDPWRTWPTIQSAPLWWMMMMMVVDVLIYVCVGGSLCVEEE